MKALVLNALGPGFDLEDVDIAAPSGAKFLSTCKRQASVTRTYCSPRTTSRRRLRCSATRSRESWRRSGPTSRNSVLAITSSGRSRRRAAGVLDVSPAAPSSASTLSRHCGGRPMRHD